MDNDVQKRIDRANRIMKRWQARHKRWLCWSSRSFDFSALFTIPTCITGLTALILYDDLSPTLVMFCLVFAAVALFVLLLAFCLAIASRYALYRARKSKKVYREMFYS